MKLEILVATMDQKNYDLLEKMNLRSDATVVNQCDRDSVDKFKHNNNTIKWINDLDRGLSKSRNTALKYAEGDICVLADDDLVYVEDYHERILEQFKLNPKADIIAFQVEGIEKRFKNYYDKPRELNLITSMKVSSVEIAFRLDKIKKLDINFNEVFGAGAKYQMGEENIFLIQCIKKGLKIAYVPIKIANLHIGESSWFTGYNKDYFISKGAQFAAMTKLYSVFYILQFSLRKHNLYKEEMSFRQSLKYMLKGRREYLG